MDFDFLILLPFVAVVGGLVTLNGLLVLLRLSHHGKDANRLVSFVAPLITLLKLGGRSGPSGEHRKA
ncbi:hypothetical protein [Mariluticola halotolerans]|uniref:hypothetical protein n=1 Tax=Mariluticola halotolerans TaxID=2909283 RepID=UPI0026E2F43C|nr:hypothetical protein [Mariluticola halotolerans]UJQ93034.1 hypothetical protein L1P08_08385 [Mariluticola halotolerans]